MNNLRYYSASKSLSIAKKICYLNTLSGKALGYYLKIVSLCDVEDWHFNLKGFTTLFPEGRDAVSSGLRELEEHGFLVRGQYRKESGQFGTDTIWIALDDPAYYNELVDDLSREGIVITSKFDASTVEQKQFIDGEGFNDVFPQVSTDYGLSENGSDQEFCETADTTDYGLSENGSDQALCGNKSVKPQVSTDYGLSEYGKSATINKLVNINNNLTSTPYILVPGYKQEPRRSMLDGWTGGLQVDNGNEKNHNGNIVGSYKSFQYSFEYDELSSSVNTPNRNRIADAFPFYCQLRESGIEADTITAAWAAYQGQDCFQNRQAFQMPQLMKWLSSDGADGARMWCTRIVERANDEAKHERSQAFRKLMSFHPEFEALVREQDAYDQSDLKHDKAAAKAAAARVRRITAILDNELAKTDDMSPDGPVDTVKPA